MKIHSKSKTMKTRKLFNRINTPTEFSYITDYDKLTQQGLSLSPSEMYSKVMSGQMHSAMVNVRLENDNGNSDWNKLEEIELANVYQHVESAKKKVVKNVELNNQELENKNSGKESVIQV